MLTRLGVMVTIANHGQEALELIAREDFDVVLMDCQMPVMDGYQATTAIRIREHKMKLDRLTIIAMTANAMAGDRERCLAAGMDDHLAKPIKERLLSDTVHHWLRKNILNTKATPTIPSTEHT